MAPSHVRVAARLHVMQLTGESAGQPLSSEISPSACRPRTCDGKATRAVTLLASHCETPRSRRP